LIALAIDARRQRYPDEKSYVYQPLVGEEDATRRNNAARKHQIKDYNVRDFYI